MTVVNPKSISGINSITTGSGSDDLLTIHTNNGTERLRVDSTGATKIVTGIVTTLTATTGIVTTLTSNTTTLNSTTTATGNVNVSGANITLQDSGGSSDDRLVFGAGSDLSIYHDGSHSYIDNTGTGNLYIKDAGAIRINTDSFGVQKNDGSESIISGTADGAVELYYDNSKKFETHDRGTIFTEAGSGTSQAAIKVNTTLDDYGVITVRDRSDVNNQISGFQVENAGSGTDETNLLLRSVNLNSTAYSHGLYAAKSHKFAVSNNTTPTVQIDSDGLKFNNDQAAANALDDYEEGTWTPTNASGQSVDTIANGGAWSISGGAKYTKIGEMVTVYISHWQIPSTGGNYGFAIGGLPFTSMAGIAVGTNTIVSNSTNAEKGLVVANTTKIYLYPANTLSQTTNAGLSAKTLYGISATYRVA